MAMTRNLRFFQFHNDLNKVITEDEFINQTDVIAYNIIHIQMFL